MANAVLVAGALPSFVGKMLFAMGIDLKETGGEKSTLADIVKFRP